MTEYDAIVLAGGSAKRLGGVDKPGLNFGGRTSLDRVIDAVADAEHVVVVGPVRPTERMVTWCCEFPQGGGPVAALRTGLAYAGADRVVVLAADIPLVDAALVARLLGAIGNHDGTVVVDSSGREQLLVGAYRRERLAANVEPLPGTASMRRAVTGLELAHVTDERDVSVDCDTWDAVEKVRGRL